jgi:hypothetical protein
VGNGKAESSCRGNDLGVKYNTVKPTHNGSRDSSPGVGNLRPGRSLSAAF